MNPIHRNRPPTAYRLDAGQYLVELTLGDARQLFNSLDPAPFRERDLDGAAEEYIVTALREIGMSRPARVVIHIPTSGLAGENAPTIESAIRHYFDYRAEHTSIELRMLIGRGVLSLLIASVFLLACLWARQLIDRQTGHPILTEGLLILGWVAMWRPVEVFLYDWWPILHRVRIYRHIAKLPVEVRSS
jgi:hypothetical protein